MYFSGTRTMALNSKAISQEDLFKALQAGDEAAITWVYQEHGEVLFTVCRRYADSQEMAEDFFQDGLMHILSQITKFNGRSSFHTWAYRVMANYCINQLRKASNKIKWVGLEDTDLENNEDEDYDEEGKISMEKIVECMQEMPPGFKLVLNMYAVEGRSHSEIATALGISESTSKSQLFKARRWLKNKIEGGANAIG
jgi:RNA polymerase sigma-70 factor (ECF subfamily)